MEPISIEEGLTAFLSFLSDEGDDDKTLRWYIGLLTAFASVTPGALEDVTTEYLKSYVGKLKSRRERYPQAKQKPTQPGGLSPVTIRGHIRALKTFFKWAHQTGLIDDNPALTLGRERRRRPGDTAPKTVDAADLRALIETCQGDDPINIRDLAIFGFMIDTMCRREGVTNLLTSDLHIEQRYAIVLEKYDKRREVYFTSPLTVLWLNHWLEVRPPWDKHVFVSLGDRNRASPLQPGALNQMFERRCLMAGLKHRVKPHMLRHTGATIYAYFADQESLRRELGHESQSTVQIYINFNREQLQKRHEEAGVLERILGLRT